MTGELPAQYELMAVPPPSGIPEDVARLFEQAALQVWDRGFRRYSADAILHRIRWQMQIDRGNREWKVNNNFSAPLARWFLKNHRECDGFFELRASPYSGVSG